VGDFTRAGDIESPVAVPVQIGQIYIDREKLSQPYPIGRVWIVDVQPFDGEATKACIEATGGTREWLSVEDLRRRFKFRRAAV
jgi:hypothetical protein